MLPHELQLECRCCDSTRSSSQSAQGRRSSANSQGMSAQVPTISIHRVSGGKHAAEAREQSARVLVKNRLPFRFRKRGCLPHFVRTSDGYVTA
jgi:hypothetical protein